MVIVTYEAKAEEGNRQGLESLNIVIDNVQLGLLRIKQQNTEGTKAGIYIPVWAFYGTVIYQYPEEAFYKYGKPETSYNDGQDFPNGPFIVLAINAVDGSIIDTSVGY